jgi:hypothetical protein
LIPVPKASFLLARRACALLLWILCSSAAWGHAASKSQLIVRFDAVALRGELTASPVDVALALHVPPARAPGHLRLQIDAGAEEWREYVARGRIGTRVPRVSQSALSG